MRNVVCARIPSPPSLPPPLPPFPPLHGDVLTSSRAFVNDDRLEHVRDGPSCVVLVRDRRNHMLPNITLLQRIP